MDTREAYFEYLESILIKNDKEIEPSLSEITFMTRKDPDSKLLCRLPELRLCY